MPDSVTEQEMLKYAVDNGIIDITLVQKKIEMKKREEILNQHSYSIWQGKNGKWFTHLPNNNGGRILKKRNTKEEIEDLVVDYIKANMDVPTIESVFELWAGQKLEYGEIEKQTYDRYKTDLYRFFKSNLIFSKDIRLITTDELENFVKMSIRDGKLTSKAYAGLRTIIKGVFKYAKKHGWTDISISQFFGDMEISKKTFSKKMKFDEDEVFTDAEVRKIQEYVFDNPTMLNLGILFAFMTGLRVGELSALTRNDLKDSILTINKTEVRYRGEDGKYVFEVREFPKTEAGYRRIVIGKEAVYLFEKIRHMNPFGEYLFMKKGMRIKEKSFTTKLYGICEKVGIPKRSMHKARKTYGTKLLNARVDEKIIINQMGHADIGCTKNFYYFNNKSLEASREMIDNAVNYE